MQSLVQQNSSTYRVYNEDGSYADVQKQDTTILAFVGMLTSNPATTVAGSTTTIASFGGNSTFSTSAAARRSVVVNACTIKNLYVMVNGTQPSDGALVFTVLKNGSALSPSITCTVPLSTVAATQNFSDTTHSGTFVAGDLISLQIANASASTSLTVESVSIGMYNAV